MTWLVCCWCLAAPGVTHAEPSVLTGLAVLVDPLGIETIESVSSPQAQDRFKPMAGPLSAGYSRSVRWLRFTLTPASPGEWWLEVLPAVLDYLTLYEPTGDGFTAHRAGDRLPFSGREVNYRGFVFKLPLAGSTPATFYLRLQTSSVSLATLRLWDPVEFHAAKNTEYALHGVFYGVFLLVLMFNLTLWRRLQSSVYGWFSLCVLTTMMLFLGNNGFIGQYVFPDSPVLADRWVGVHQLLVMAASSPFYSQLLRVTRDQTFYWYLFRVQLLLPCLMLGPFLFGYVPQAAGLLRIYSALGFIFLLGRFYSLWRDNTDDLRWLVIAAGLALVGYTVSLVIALGVLPGAEYLIYLNQGSFFLLMMAMQVALILRLRALQSEQLLAKNLLEVAERDAQRERVVHADQARFIAMLSHELKTPLAVIDGASQALARMGTPDNPEADRRHERIRRSVGRIDRLVEQLLSKDRLESGLQLRVRQVDLCNLLHQILDSRDDMRTGRIQLNLPLQAQIQGDPALLQVALTNLVDNALKYAPAGSLVTVTLRMLKGEPSGAVITVEDDGPGVPEALRADIFKAYSRGSNAGQVPGAGLGLYLVQRIVGLHGGRITLEPSQRGAFFQLQLPTSPVAQSPLSLDLKP